MAFAGSGFSIRCGICGDSHKVFKLWDSGLFSPEMRDEPEPENIITGEPPAKRRARICSFCELTERQKLYAKKFAENDEVWLETCKPGWSTLQQVSKDMKAQQKGDFWAAKGLHYAQANEMVSKMKNSNLLSRKEKAAQKTSMSKQLAGQFLSVIKGGKLFAAFRDAGLRISRHMVVSDELHRAFQEYIDGPSEERLAKLEELEDMQEVYEQGTLYVELFVHGGEGLKSKQLAS